MCVLPVGSLEQHGEHLPVGTDSLLVEDGLAACRGARAARRPRGADGLDRAQPAPRPPRADRDPRAGARARADPLDRGEPARLVRGGRDRQRPRRQPRLARRRSGSSTSAASSTTGSSSSRRCCGSSSRSTSARSGTPARPRPRRCSRCAPELVGETAGAAFEPIERDERRLPASRHGCERRPRRPVRGRRRRRRALPRRGRCRARPPARRPSVPDLRGDPEMTDLPRRCRLAAARPAPRTADGRVHPAAVERERLRAAARGGGPRLRARRHPRRPLRGRHRRASSSRRSRP